MLLFYSCLMSAEDMQNKNLIVLHDFVFNASNTCDNKVWNLNFFLKQLLLFLCHLEDICFFCFFFTLKVWILRHLNENVIEYKLTVKESTGLHQNPSYTLSTGFSLKPIVCRKKKKERERERGEKSGANWRCTGCTVVGLECSVYLLITARTVLCGEGCLTATLLGSAIWTKWVWVIGPL